MREFQPARWGWTPHHGLLEVRARMEISPRSMAAVWMVGPEDEPARSAEICILEVFGDTLDVGMGVHPFRDPAIVTTSPPIASASTSRSTTSTPPIGGPGASTSWSTART